ncbi:Mobile element protein [Desulfurella amilsii]|uniref:Mobile element protein n=1 Tax=Desulfurella amilsii TaxID=1562698 RepID=A0A1X4XZ92_9BACT|nr:transposase [Desulfurella amilsii]OSS42775.1 Mobile element protein [Desulfurella amilsii]OSS42850.1 Mobile element protein [Desulfurella amilsii]
MNANKLPLNSELRIFTIRIKNKKFVKTLTDYIYKYRHFENILLILIKENYELFLQGKTENDFKYLTSKITLRNALLNYNSKNSKDSNYLNEKYKDHKLWQALKETVKTIKQHNFTYCIERVKANYKTYFTNLKAYNKNSSAYTGMPKPPKAKKLSKLLNYSIDLDKYCSLSFKKLNQNLIGINLADKMLYIHHSKSDIESIVGNLKNINSAKLVFDRSQISLQVSYIKKIKPLKLLKPVKEAGLDIGLNNLASLFVNDETTPSLIVDGKPYKHYNTKFNRLLGKLQESLKDHVLEWSISKTGTKYPAKYDKKGYQILKFISYLHSKRNRFFFDKFHKVSKRILEYCQMHDVTDLYISKNLAQLKNNGDCNLRKAQKQNFIQIPFIKLLKDIEYKAKYYGINVHIIDEAYSSKTSSVSGNVVYIQKQAQALGHDTIKQLAKTDLANAFSGKRAKRGLFIDTTIKKVFNADLNGAVNHIKIAKDINTSYLKRKLFKLCNPIKLKSDCDFCRLMQNSVSGKAIGTDLLQRQVSNAHGSKYGKLNSGSSYGNSLYQSLIGLE